MSSIQLRILGLGFFEDRNVGVGIFPNGEEVLIGAAGTSRIARQSARPRQLEMSQGTLR